MGELLDKELAQQLRLLEGRIDAALELIDRQRRENRKLQEKLAESLRIQKQVLERLNAVLDRIDHLA